MDLQYFYNWLKNLAAIYFSLTECKFFNVTSSFLGKQGGYILQADRPTPTDYCTSYSFFTNISEEDSYYYLQDILTMLTRSFFVM